MFSKTTSKKEDQAARTPFVPATAPRVEMPAVPVSKNYISAGTVIEGSIVSSEDLEIDGTVRGDVRTSARLILGKESCVEGNLVAAEAEVAGLITGTVESKGLLSIRATCRIEGDIVTQSLNVESGSSFNGRCKVGAHADGQGAKSAPRTGAAAPTPADVKLVAATKA